MILAGLEPNRSGAEPSPTHRQFPSVEQIEKRWNDERMPWPKNYGEVDPETAFRRRA